jgi:hypothetical protein
MENSTKICRCVGCKRDPEKPCKREGHHHDEHHHHHAEEQNQLHSSERTDIRHAETLEPDLERSF